MIYYVFSAGKRFPENQLSIKAAKAAYHALDLKHMLDYDAVGACYAKLTLREDSNNIYITVEDDYEQRVCDGIKEFCYWHARYEQLMKDNGDA